MGTVAHPSQGGRVIKLKRIYACFCPSLHCALGFPTLLRDLHFHTGSVLCALTSTAFDKCSVSCSHYDGDVQNGFRAHNLRLLFLFVLILIRN